jgi:hypothetical protein
MSKRRRLGRVAKIFLPRWQSLPILRESQLVAIDVTNELSQVEELIRILTAIVKTTGET